MGRAMQIRPARVLETVTEELRFGVMARYKRDTPPWFEVLHRIPPSEKLARPVPVKHRILNERKMKGPRRSLVPQRIIYPEDRLRKDFFTHHPWELARPRIISEDDGRDAECLDWSKGLRQPRMPLSGER